MLLWDTAHAELLKGEQGVVECWGSFVLERWDVDDRDTGVDERRELEP